MSDLYAHFHAKRSGEQEQNLVELGRFLVLNRQSIDADRTLAFTDTEPQGPVAASITLHALPALAHGPRAGIAALPEETWPAYWQRAFGVSPGSPMLPWLHAPMWSKTDPSAMGAGLRFAYALDYGVPHDHIEIAMGQAWSDYDSSSFLWERLEVFPLDDGGQRLHSQRKQPKWIGAVELDRMRRAVTITADNLVPTLAANGIAEPDSVEGCSEGEIAALQERIGQMPRSYIDLLRRVGRRGWLVHRNGLRLSADQLDDVNRIARRRIFETAAANDDPVPRDAIFIGDRHGNHPLFVLAGQRAESPVFQFHSGTGKVSQVGITVWAWMESHLRELRPDLQIALSENEAATVARLNAIADDMNARVIEANRRHEGAGVAGWTLLFGGATLVAAAIAYQLWRVLAA